MITGLVRIIGAGLFFLVIFFSGYSLKRSGKPYNTILFNVHKLMSVAVFIFLAVIAYKTERTAMLSIIELMFIGITVLFFFITIVTGGILSVKNSMPDRVQMMHMFLPYLTMLFTTVTLFILYGHKL